MPPSQARRRCAIVSVHADTMSFPSWYAYLKEIFRQLRAELGIVVPRTPKRLPYVPSEDEIRRYYETNQPASWCKPDRHEGDTTRPADGGCHYAGV